MTIAITDDGTGGTFATGAFMGAHTRHGRCDGYAHRCADAHGRQQHGGSVGQLRGYPGASRQDLFGRSRGLGGCLRKSVDLRRRSVHALAGAGAADLGLTAGTATASTTGLTNVNVLERGRCQRRDPAHRLGADLGQRTAQHPGRHPEPLRFDDQQPPGCVRESLGLAQPYLRIRTSRPRRRP